MGKHKKHKLKGLWDATAKEASTATAIVQAPSTLERVEQQITQRLQSPPFGSCGLTLEQLSYKLEVKVEAKAIQDLLFNMVAWDKTVQRIGAYYWWIGPKPELLFRQPLLVKLRHPWYVQKVILARLQRPNGSGLRFDNLISGLDQTIAPTVLFKLVGAQKVREVGVYYWLQN